MEPKQLLDFSSDNCIDLSRYTGLIRASDEQTYYLIEGIFVSETVYVYQMDIKTFNKKLEKVLL